MAADDFDKKMDLVVTAFKLGVEAAKPNEYRAYIRGVVDAFRAVIVAYNKGGTLLPISVKLGDIADAIETEGFDAVKAYLEAQK